MKNLDQIIRLYKATYGKNPDTCIKYAKGQRNLAETIRVSTLSIDENQKRHGHQRRIPLKVLELWQDAVLRKFRQIQRSSSFDDLHTCLTDSKIFGIGPLTVYDTATRIGAYMNLYPDKVYLHAGTREGAKKLAGNASGRFILKKDLPNSFHRKDLACWEIEDILCIFKDDLDKEISESEFKRRCLQYAQSDHC
jgi:hypothetical protein